MQAPKKILVVQLRRIGDVILTLPAIAALRRAYPNAIIDFLAEPPSDQIARYSPDISEVIVYNKNRQFKAIAQIRKRKYDWVIDYLGNPRSIMLTALSGAKIKAGINDVFWSFLYNLKLTRKTKDDYIASEKIKQLEPLGVTFDQTKTLPVITLPQDLENLAKEELQKLGVLGYAPLIALSPVSRRETRRYPKEHFITLASMLTRQLNAKIIVFWGPGEKEIAQEICAKSGSSVYLAPQTGSLGLLAAMLKQCSLLISNCNGTKHIALAAGTPTLTIHGSSSCKVWTPSGFACHSAIFNEEANCAPCRSNVCRFNLQCLNDIEPEEVFLVAENLLAACPGKKA